MKAQQMIEQVEHNIKFNSKQSKQRNNKKIAKCPLCCCNLRVLFYTDTNHETFEKSLHCPRWQVLGKEYKGLNLIEKLYKELKRKEAEINDRGKRRNSSKNTKQKTNQGLLKQ